MLREISVVRSQPRPQAWKPKVECYKTSQMITESLRRSLLVLLRMHDGKLRYDDRLTDVFPDFPEYGKRITIRHLLNHTSGLPDYESLMEDGRWTAERQILDAEVLELLKKEKAGRFAQGTR